MSGNSWANMGQECIKCHINVYPHKQVTVHRSLICTYSLSYRVESSQENTASLHSTWQKTNLSSVTAHCFTIFPCSLTPGGLELLYVFTTAQSNRFNCGNQIMCDWSRHVLHVKCFYV